MTTNSWVQIRDWFGKFLLCWFVLETVLYYWSGRFLIELEGISSFYRRGSYLWALHHSIMVPVAGLAILFMGPLLLKGRLTGFCLALVYWPLGNVVNPFWYIFPHRWQATVDGPTIFLWVINIAWSLIVLLGIIGFFFSRRSTPNLTLQPIAQSSG
jgi:hypothetical protein